MVLADQRRRSRARLASMWKAIVPCALLWLGLAACVKTGAPPVAGPATAPTASADHAGMVRVPGGTFQMGSPDGEGDDNEHPRHQVTVSPFYMDVTEVTVAAYALCVTAGACTAPRTWSECSWAVPGREQDPVNCVNWAQADAYCRWAGKRLPTEAEWELGARGTDGRMYPWGNQEPGSQLCWNRAPAEKTCPAGAHPGSVSPSGLHDMAGNVWEWVADWYGPYQSATATDPSGPAAGQERALRGGSWDADDEPDVSTARRLPGIPERGDTALGFRCVLPPGQ